MFYHFKFTTYLAKTKMFHTKFVVILMTYTIQISHGTLLNLTQILHDKLR